MTTIVNQPLEEVELLTRTRFFIASAIETTEVDQQIELVLEPKLIEYSWSYVKTGLLAWALSFFDMEL